MGGKKRNPVGIESREIPVDIGISVHFHSPAAIYDQPLEKAREMKSAKSPESLPKVYRKIWGVLLKDFVVTNVTKKRKKAIFARNSILTNINCK